MAQVADESKFKENINKILEVIKDSIEKTADFAQEQVPLFLQELINYYIFYHAAIALIAGIALFFTLKYGIRLACNYPFSGGSDDVGKGAGSIPLFIVSAVSIGFIITNVFYLVKLWIAPRLYLLDYAREIIQGGGCG